MTMSEGKASSGVRGLPVEQEVPVPSRRQFLQSFGAGSIAIATAPAWAQMSEARAEQAPIYDGAPAEGEVQIELNVNGIVHTLNVTPNAILLDVLRDRLLLTGTKKGCDLGQCGACTLLVNGLAINSCLSIAVQHHGDSITTVEGLEKNGELHPIQEAFWEHDAYQCGYCTSGQMMNALSVIQDPNIAPDDASVREAMSGNICRCGAYTNIVAAIQSAREKMKG